MAELLLGVNIDHIATLRNARGTAYPDPVQAAFIVEQAGADGITVHLREDRRHITDRDVRILRQTLDTRMNLEMAVTEEMLGIPPTSALLKKNSFESSLWVEPIDFTSNLSSRLRSLYTQ